MRIYMAAVYHGGRASSTASSIHLQISSRYIYPWVLESFHYADKTMVDGIRANKQTIFLDSGAFSMFTQGVKVDLQDYARFILRHQDILHITSNLDVIGQHAEQESYERQKTLERYLGDKKHMIKPVHHVRDDDYWLEKYLDEGYDYIFLGGMVPETTPVLMQWLDHIWPKYLIKPDGTPKIKIHGFGLTTEALMFRYPWFSVDSTSWVMVSRFGGLMMDFPQEDGTLLVKKIDFSNRSAKRYDSESWHYQSLANYDPDLKKVIDDRLEQLEAERTKEPDIEALFKTEFGCPMGFNPQALSLSYGLRDIGNMEYYRRAMNRRVDRFTRIQETLF